MEVIASPLPTPQLDLLSGSQPASNNGIVTQTQFSGVPFGDDRQFPLQYPANLLRALVTCHEHVYTQTHRHMHTRRHEHTDTCMHLQNAG